MAEGILSQRRVQDKQLILSLPAGSIGVHFSNTIPCEICRVDEGSPIFDSVCQFLGRVAFHVSIPNKLDIHGALDNKTLEMILAAYSNEPNRKLMFVNRSRSSNKGLFTTTVLPRGPVNASFRTTKGLFASRNRVSVGKPGENMNFEFPVGHYVEKVIIPNQLVIEGGIRTPERLRETLNHFSDVPGRKLVFQKKIPKGGIVTTVAIPKGPLDVKFYPANDDALRLPVVTTYSQDFLTWKLNVTHVVEKLIIPNEVTIERMGCTGFTNVLNDFSEVQGRIIVLQEFHKDISRCGAKVTITLPTGNLDVAFRTGVDYIVVDKVKEYSQVKKKVPPGYYVESVIIPGVLELIGKDELLNATCLLETLDEFSYVQDRVLVLKELKEDVKKHIAGKQFKAEFV